MHTEGIDIILESEPNFEQSQQVDMGAVLHTEEVQKAFRTEAKKPAAKPVWNAAPPQKFGKFEKPSKRKTVAH